MSQAVPYAPFPAKTLKNTDFFLVFQREHKEAYHRTQTFIKLGQQ